MPTVPTRDRRQFQKAGSQPAPVPDDPPEVAASDGSEDELPPPLGVVASTPVTRPYSRPVAAAAPAPELGTTGGVIPRQAGTWDKKPVGRGRLSDDPVQREQQSIAAAQADFEEKQRAVNPHLFSGAVTELSKVGGRRYDERAIREGEHAYADQLQGERAQIIGQRRAEQEAMRTENAEREAQFRSTGQQFYTDPHGRIQPVVDPRGRSMYHPTVWEPGEHPKTKLPVLQKRDQFGQRQFKTPPIVASPDLTDDQLYYKFADDDLRPAGKIEELVNHADFGIARTAKRAASQRKTAMWKEAISPMEAVKADTEVAFEQGQQRAIELQGQIEQLTQQASGITPEALEETQGGIMGFGGTPTPAAQQAQQTKAAVDAQLGALLTEQAALNESLKPMGTLGRTKRQAALDLAIFKAKAAHESYTDLADERRLILKEQGKSEEDDPTLKSILEAQATYGTQLQRAAGVAEQEALAASRASRAAPETAPVAAPAPVDSPSGGTVKQGAKAFTRGALAEGVYAAIEGGARLASLLASSEVLPTPWGGTIDAKANVPAGLQKYVKEYADATQQVRQQIRAALPLDQEFAESLTGKISQGLGQAAGTLPLAVLPGGIAATALTQIYDEGYQDAKASGATDEQANSAAIKYLPAAALDYLSEKLIIGKILKPLVGKMTVGRFVKDILAMAATEGGTEGAQQAYLNQIASKLEGYDPSRPFDQEVLDSIIVGAVVGGTVTGGAQAVKTVAGPGAAPAGAPAAPTDPAGTPSRNFPTDDRPVSEIPVRPLSPEQQEAEAEFQRRLAALPPEERAEMDKLLAESEPVGAEAPAAAPETATPVITAPVPESAVATTSNEPTLSAPAPAEPARPVAEVPASVPEQATPDVPAREAVVEPGRPPVVAQSAEATASDRAEYDRLQAEMERIGFANIDDPAYRKAWQASEDIKNRHGGMVPTAPSAESVSGQESVATPAVAGDAAQGRTSPSQEVVTASAQKVEELARQGFTALQIAARLNSTKEAIQEVAKQSGIALPMKSSRKPDIVMTPIMPEAAPVALPSREQRLNDAGAELPPISSMSRVQKRAELDAAGITTYRGKPLDEANPAEISNAVGKLRRGELTAEGEKPSAAPRTSDKIIAALQKAKIRKPGELHSAAEPFTIAYDAALDIAILGIRAGRALADVVKLAIARFKAKHPKWTEEEVGKLTAAINEAHANPPPPSAPKAATSKVPESLRARDVPAEDISYEARNQDERMKEARTQVDADPIKAETAIADRSVAADTRVALGGVLLEKKMAELANAKTEDLPRITRDINRITAAIRSGVSTESGQGVAMHNRIYQNLGVRSSMEYVNQVQHDRVEKMGGKRAEDAAQEVAEEFNKTKDQAQRDAAIERLKKRYTEKPVTNMLNALKGLERAMDLNRIGALTRDDMIDVAGKALGLPGVSGDKLRHIATLVDKIENAKTLADAELAQLELTETIANYKGTNIIDLISSMTTLNVLLAPNTQAANAGGNAMRLVTELASVAAVNPTMARQSAIWEGFKDGLPLGWEQARSIWQTGRGTRDLQDKTIGVTSDVERADFRQLKPDWPKAVTGTLNMHKKLMSKVGRFMRSVDAMAYYPAREAYARVVATKFFEGDLKGEALEKKVAEILYTTPKALNEARTQAKSEGYTGISVARRASEIIEARRGLTDEGAAATKEAEKFAAETTYTNEPEGNAGVAYRAAVDAVGGIRWKGVPILKPWMMFLRTPTNMFNATLNWTPAGFERAISGSIKDEGSRRGRESRRQYTEDERNRMFFQASVGSALMAGTFAAVMKGLMDVTFRGPQDKERREQLMAAGWRPFSVKVGDGPYMSYRDTPALLPLAITGHVSDSMKYGGGDEKDMLLESRIADAIVSAPLEAFFASSPLTGMADLLAAATGRGRGVARGLTSLPANVAFPGVRTLMELDRYLDPKVYDSNQLKQTIPFVRRDGTARTDAQGRPVQSRPVDRFMGTTSKDPIDRFILEKRVFIPGVGHSLKIGTGPRERDMTDEEKNAYKRDSGRRIRARIQAVLPRLKILSQEDAQSEISKIASEERARVKPLIGITIKK